MSEVPPPVVTATSTVPSVTVAGDVTVMEVGLVTVTPVPAVEPKATVAPDTKPVPAMTTDVPPEVGPVFGVSDVTGLVRWALRVGLVKDDTL